MRCPSCQATLVEESRFCFKCGAPVPPEGASTASEALPPALARALGAQYTIIRLLGRGGMGAVYLAREQALDRLVAIKVLRPEMGGSSAGRERFRREARTAARLTHPGIVPLHSFGEAEGVMYFVMGYVRGESLAARIRREGRLPIDETREVLAEIADALDYAHRQGVVHRDVKPDNVLVEDESGRAMLTDFGIAKAASSGETLTQTGSILGTPDYMSPEQASGQATIDGRSDIYSLGVLGYVMLSGRLPFEGDSPRDILLKHLTQEPPPLRSVAAGLPEGLATAVTRCLAKDATARWPDARSLREALAPDGGAEWALPAGLEALESQGTWLVPWAFAVAYLVWLAKAWSLSPRLGSPLSFILALLLILPARLAGRVSTARRSGFAWGEILRALYLQPQWWPGSYPRALRWPGDVWDRLPVAAKWLRSVAVVLVLLAAAVVLGLFSLSNPDLSDRFAFPKSDEDYRLSRKVFFLTTLIAVDSILGCVLGLGWYVLGKRWTSARGLQGIEGYRFLVEPTMRSPFWRRPHVALLLTPPAPRGEPRSPREHLEALAQAARVFTGPVREAGEESLALARTLDSRIAVIDAEMARLAGDADAGEARRLAERLAALGSPTDAEGTERRQMRELLSRQLALVRGVGERLAEAQGRRDRLAGLLHRLWREGPRAVRTPDAAEAGRLRALCAELGAEARRLEQAAVIGDLPTLER